MKHLLIGIAMLFTAQLCSAQKITSKEDLLQRFAIIGEQHNQALDIIYNDILKKGPGPLSSNVPNADKIKYLDGIILGTPPYNPYPASVKDILDNSLQASDKALLRSFAKNETRSIAELIIAEVKMSAGEQDFYNKLEQIIYRNRNNTGLLYKELETFNESVFQQFGINSNSTYMLIAGSVMAKASSAYWSENTAKWSALNADIKSNGAVSRSAEADCCRGIVKADVAGAVTGAVSGAIGGALGGAGVGAIPGAIAGGTAAGVGASAGAAVTTLLNWLWP